MATSRHELARENRPMMEIYTDGSCHPNPGRGGWAMVVYEGGREAHTETGHEQQTTNNRMEFEAILAALIHLNGRAGIVYSDSEYCIKCITQWCKKWQRNGWRMGKNGGGGEIKNLDLIQSCLAELGKAKLQWVRGHNGNAGNERADVLARDARIGATRERVAA